MPELQHPGAGDRNAWFAQWPDVTYDWKAAGVGIEPVSGLTLSMASGAVGDFTTLQFTPAGLVFDINNTSGGDVGANFECVALPGVPAASVRHAQMVCDLDTMSTGGTSILRFGYLDDGIAGASTNHLLMLMIGTAGSRRQTFDMKTDDVTTAGNQAAFAGWNNGLTLVGRNSGDVTQSGIWQGGAYTANTDVSDKPMVWTPGKNDTYGRITLYVTNGEQLAGTLSFAGIG